jgi:hypothetical protein
MLRTYSSCNRVHTRNDYHISRPMRHTVLFSLGILEKRKNDDECILILVIYLEETGCYIPKLATII